MLGIGIAAGAAAGTVTASGTGTNNTVAKFTGSSTLANSAITDNGTNIALGEIVNSYNGVALTGQGLTSTPAGVSLAAQGFAVFNTATPVTLITASGGNAGTYRVSIYFVITTAFVTNSTEVITVGWTDDQGARTANVSLAITLGANGSLTQLIRSTGSAAITYTPSVTGSAATAGAAAFSVVVERII